MPDHAKKPFRDSTTIREREHVIHSTTAAAKAMETDLLPQKSANRLAWISMVSIGRRISEVLYLRQHTLRGGLAEPKFR